MIPNKTEKYIRYAKKYAKTLISEHYERDFVLIYINYFDITIDSKKIHYESL